MNEEIDHWNYRVLARSLATPSGIVDDWFEIIECYYDSSGRIVAYTQAVPPGGETLVELVDDLQRMADAIGGRSIITVNDLPVDAETPPVSHPTRR